MICVCKCNVAIKLLSVRSAVAGSTVTLSPALTNGVNPVSNSWEVCGVIVVARAGANPVVISVGASGITTRLILALGAKDVVNSDAGSIEILAVRAGENTVNANDVVVG